MFYTNFISNNNQQIIERYGGYLLPPQSMETHISHIFIFEYRWYPPASNHKNMGGQQACDFSSSPDRAEHFFAVHPPYPIFYMGDLWKGVFECSASCERNIPHIFGCMLPSSAVGCISPQIPSLSSSYGDEKIWIK